VRKNIKNTFYKIPKEIEVKILDIDVNETIKKLEKLGAKKVAEKTFSRIIFTKPGYKIPVQEWVRLRTDGQKTTIAYKKVESKEIDGIHETEVEVDNFETAAKILRSLGLVELLFQKSKRVRYKLDDIEFDIDFWPKLKPFLEIEADSKDKVKKGVKLLGFSMNQTTTKTTEEIYRDIGIDLNKIKELKFEDG